MLGSYLRGTQDHSHFHVRDNSVIGQDSNRMAPNEIAVASAVSETKCVNQQTLTLRSL